MQDRCVNPKALLSNLFSTWHHGSLLFLNFGVFVKTGNELEFTALILTPRSANLTTSESSLKRHRCAFIFPCDWFNWSDLYSQLCFQFMSGRICVVVIILVYWRVKLWYVCLEDHSLVIVPGRLSNVVLLWVWAPALEKNCFSISRGLQIQRLNRNHQFPKEVTVKVRVAHQFSWSSKWWPRRNELEIRRESDFFLSDENKLQQHEEEDLGEGEMIQRRWVRWVFSHDGSCGATLTAASVCLQLWINRLEAREPVWWKETHIPAGRRTSETGRVEVNEPGETRRPAQPEAGVSSVTVFTLRGKPKPPLLL